MSEDKRSLSNLGGPTESRGDPAFCFPLASAMEAQAKEADTLTHGFHAYPARMHPALVRSLLESFSPGPGTIVLDPFCGSGTVAIEAMVGGWRSLGSDLDPIALRLGRVKTELRSRSSIEDFLVRVAHVREASERRVQDRVDIKAKLDAEERGWYEIHVLKEMAGLLEEIRQVEHAEDRKAMEMVFSSLVVKFSKQRSETNQIKIEKRVRKGLVSEFFERKSSELAQRWRDFRKALPKKNHRAKFLLSDARTLPNTLGAEYRCDLILTSPPYGGTYDYATHHARRHAWLGMGTAGFSRSEIGSRRELTPRIKGGGNRGQGKREWDAQMLAVLKSMEALLLPSGIALLVLGDSEIAGERSAADKQLEQLAPQVGLEFLASVCQPRRDPYRAIDQERGGHASSGAARTGKRAERKEHVIALIRP